MFGNLKTDVLVVGAGPTGLLAALQLAERGVRVEVIDEEWRPAGRSYALALHPASLALLDDLGLAQDAIAQGRRLGTMALYDGHDRRATVRFDRTGERFPYLLALPQSALEELMAERLAKAGVRVRWNHRLAGLEPQGDGVVAAIHKLEKETIGYAVAHTEWAVEKKLEFRADFVVGADGHRSLVRRALGASFNEVGPSQVFAVFECSAAALADELRLVLDDTSVNALWPLPGDRARWSFEVNAPEVQGEERFKSRLTARLGDHFFHHLDETRLRELVRERARWFDPALEHVGWSIEMRFERRLATAFGRNRVWLAGDAAHLTGPVGMQSMNAGLREASDLVSRIIRIRGGAAGMDLLEAYGHERLAEWNVLLGRSGGLRARASAQQSVAKSASRLLACLPATGDGLPALAKQLDFEVALS